jgi:ABC-type bacteriocin/lantibiotic exporter with double-glycine peptidase domain
VAGADRDAARAVRPLGRPAQRLALCRVLLHEPELLVLDEPYSALDEAGAELLDAQLAELGSERTFLLATHEPARLEPFASGRLALAA